MLIETEVVRSKSELLKEAQELIVTNAVIFRNVDRKTREQMMKDNQAGWWLQSILADLHHCLTTHLPTGSQSWVANHNLINLRQVTSTRSTCKRDRRPPMMLQTSQVKCGTIRKLIN